VPDEFWITEIEAEALHAWLAVRGFEAGPLFSSRKHGWLGRVQILRPVLRSCAGISPAKVLPYALRHKLRHPPAADDRGF